MNLKEQIKEKLLEILGNDFTHDEIIIENPKNNEMGDLAIPCFTFSKKLKKSPMLIAEEIKEKFILEEIESTSAVSGYLNFFVRKSWLTEKTLKEVLNQQSNYASNNLGNNKKVIMDYSAPNIAKTFGVGHLRSTVIGNSLKLIYDKCGYETFSINHLGDYGTQFGKMLCAYNLWGSKTELEEGKVKYLTKLYVKFHEEAEKDESLLELGREYFRKLEEKDPETLEMFKELRKISLEEFNKTYDLLDIEPFDSIKGEAFFSDKTENVIKLLEENNLLTRSEGVDIVDLGDMTPAVIRKSDGTSLYMTRELAAIFYRKSEYNFDKALYVVGNEQTLHFEQVKAILKKLNLEYYKAIEHINFGLILQNGKKMSTRAGKTFSLHELLNQAIDMAKIHLSDELKDNYEIQRRIGVGAVIFNDLKNYRVNDIDFNLEDILKFEGETGPYVQYTCARINSITKNEFDIENLKCKDEYISSYIWNIITRISNTEEVIMKASIDNDPSLIAKHVISLSQDFNKFYGNEKIVDENIEFKNFKILVAKATYIVLEEGLRLLGIKIPEKM